MVFIHERASCLVIFQDFITSLSPTGQVRSLVYQATNSPKFTYLKLRRNGLKHMSANPSIRSQTTQLFGMYEIKLIILLSFWLISVTANPLPSQAEVYATATTTLPGAEPTFIVAKRRRTFNCNQEPRLKAIEAQAWADAGAMASLAAEYDNGNEWQPAMNYWMGHDSTESENFYKIICMCLNCYKKDSLHVNHKLK
jgi:hypothetical protein